jgi:probable F420-dependent oxidoreductase
VTAGLRFGVTVAAYPDGMPPADWWWRFAERAEALSFDSLWAGEHVLFHAETASAAVLLAGFAARTRTIRLGTAIYLLPLRQPVLAAKDLVTLDHVADGRLIVGVGVGGEYPQEFAACGVPLGERGTRTDEMLHLLRRLWREPRVTAAGPHFRLDEVTLTPRPRQPGGPPLWIGGRSEAALRRTARAGDGYFPYLVTPSRYRAQLDRLEALCGEAGRDPTVLERALLVFVAVGDDRETAVRGAGAQLSRIYNQPFHQLVERYAVVGTPDDCVARIAEFEAAGVRHFVFNWACPQAQIFEQVERLAREVLPRAGAGRH